MSCTSFPCRITWSSAASRSIFRETRSGRPRRSCATAGINFSAWTPGSCFTCSRSLAGPLTARLLQMDIDQAEGGRRDARDARRLRQGRRTGAAELLDDLSRQTRQAFVVELRGDAPPLFALQPFAISFLALDVAAVTQTARDVVAVPPRPAPRPGVAAEIHERGHKRTRFAAPRRLRGV